MYSVGTNVILASNWLPSISECQNAFSFAFFLKCLKLLTFSTFFFNGSKIEAKKVSYSIYKKGSDISPPLNFTSHLIHLCKKKKGGVLTRILRNSHASCLKFPPIHRKKKKKEARRNQHYSCNKK